MEKYISKCLESLIIPSIDKLDIIVVNDGSKDKSSEIAHSYSDKYPDSIRVIDKENGNYGSCINAALPTIKGKYVKILDADDTFNTENLEKYIKLLSQYNESLIITNFIRKKENGKLINQQEYSYLIAKDVYRFNEILDFLANPKLTMHAVTFRSNVFKNLNYHQTEGISYTDNEWLFLPFSRVDEIRYINISIYELLRGREGQTMDSKVISKQLDHFEKILWNSINIYENNKNVSNPYVLNYFSKRIRIIAQVIYHNYLFINSEEFNEKLIKTDDKFKKIDIDLYNEILNNMKLSYFNSNISKYWISKGRKVNLPLIRILRNLKKIRN